MAADPDAPAPDPDGSNTGGPEADASVSLDPVIHAPARLRIMASLAGLADGDTIKFPRLQKVLDMTGGNLLTHLRKLEDAGYVRSEKAGRTTMLSLTASGRAAFEMYRQSLRDLLGSAGE